MRASRTSVRTGTPADLAPLLASDPLLARHAWREELVRAALERGTCLVATDGDDLAGYAVADHSLFGRGFVPLLHVDAARRRRGVGDRLLAEAEARCRTPRLFTSTTASNAPMRALLAKRGFRETGSIGDLDPGDREVFYVKDLG